MKRILVYGLANYWGGIESIVLSIIRHMPADYVFDLLLSNEECQYEDRLPAGNVRVRRVTAWGSHPFRFGKELKELYQQVHYDFVWLNLCCRSNRKVISVTRRYSEAKIILHSHAISFEADNRLKFWFLSMLHQVNKKYYLENMDYALACSEKSADWFYGKNAMAKYEIRLLKNGIDTDHFIFRPELREQYRSILGITDELVLLHVGRLSQVKNQKFILDVFHDLLKRDRKVRLLIVGEGELQAELEEYSRKLGISDQVSFLGLRKDINNIMQAADIFLLPSFHEGFAIVLVEAQAAGLLTIASDQIPHETRITGLLHFLPIHNGTRSWVDMICHTDHVRTDCRKEIKAAGYDITDVVEDMKCIFNNE